MGPSYTIWGILVVLDSTSIWRIFIPRVVTLFIVFLDTVTLKRTPNTKGFKNIALLLAELAEHHG